MSFLKGAVDELLNLTSLYRATLFDPMATPVAARREAMRRAEDEADVDN